MLQGTTAPSVMTACFRAQIPRVPSSHARTIANRPVVGAVNRQHVCLVDTLDKMSWGWGRAESVRRFSQLLKQRTFPALKADNFPRFLGGKCSPMKKVELFPGDGGTLFLVPTTGVSDVLSRKRCIDRNCEAPLHPGHAQTCALVLSVSTLYFIDRVARMPVGRCILCVQPRENSVHLEIQADGSKWLAATCC